MDAENNNIVYDAENAPAPELVEESLNKDDVVYDFQDEINKTAEKNGVDPVQKKEEPSTETEDENLEFKPIGDTDENGNLLEEQKNVFTDGLQDGKFIPNHRCPVCFMPKKTIRGLEVYKKIGFLKRKKERIGYMSICLNCGFTSFYTNKPEELLLYFRGKVSKS